MRLLLCGLLACLAGTAPAAQVPFEDLTLPSDAGTVRSLDAANFFLVAGTSTNQARVYTRSAVGAPWLLDAVLAPADGSPVCFGYDVAYSQNRVIVADPCKDTGGASDGRVHIFRRDTGGWVEEVVLMPNANDADLDFYGYRVALDGPLAAVSAPDQVNDGEGSFGGTDLYALQGGVWVASGSGSDAFTVAIAEPYAAVGGGRGRGFTQVFEFLGAGWSGTQLPAEPGSGAGASRGPLGLSDERLLRVGNSGIRAWEHRSEGWTRVAELPLSSGTGSLDVRGGRAAATVGASVVLYRTDASGLGWAGPTTVGTRSGCEPEVAPTFVVCRAVNNGSGTATLRIYDTSALAAPPDTPLPTLPADGATVGRNVTFEWPPVAGATSYVLEYSPYPDLIAVSMSTEPERVTSTTPSVTVNGLLEATTYYWHVRAVAPGESSAWSRTRSLYVGAGLPSAPALVAPAAGSVIAPEVATLRFQWSAATFAETYRLQVARDAAFETIAVDTTTALLQADVALAPLERGVRYFWRVLAQNAAGATPSNPRSFDLAPSAPTAVPVLASPADGAENVERLVMLAWNETASATAYDLQLANSAAFDPIVLQQTGIVATTFTPSSPLVANREYFWRVRATNTGGAGPWSAPWRFVTGGQIVGSEATPDGEATLAVAPNPSAAGAQATLVVPSAARAAVEVYDVQGRVVAVLSRGALSAGAHRYALPPGLPSGRYVVRAEFSSGAGDARVLTVPVVVAR